MTEIAILGGSALPQLKGIEITDQKIIETPYGPTSAPLLRGLYEGFAITFLDRHGKGRSTPPHKINYQANIWALQQAGVEKILSVSIVGGIRSDMTPGHFAFPNQLIDYTYNRPNTFFEDDFNFSRHIDFTHPYCPELHKVLVEEALRLGLDFTDDATYGVTQGPRFETVAEVNRLERDGCDIIGMTAMPEAALARELGMRYASIAIVGTKAAGRSDGLHVDIQEIKSVVDDSLEKLYELLSKVIVRV